MTDKTAIYGARVGKETIERLEGIDRRRLIEEVGRLVSEGKLVFKGDGLVTEGDCDGCPYVDDLDMGKFNEVCEFKDLDRQKALDRCVSMLWR